MLWGKGVGGGRGVAVAGLRWRWRRGGAGCVLAACAFFDVVVDVPVVQVVDVGLSSSWTRLSCPLLCKTGVWVQTVQPGNSAVAVLGQGGDMPVLAHVVFFVLKTVKFRSAVP